MQDYLMVTGMVLKAEPIGEYDKRIVILTTDHGKISAFARGARRPNNKMLAASNPFCFGEFKLYPGKNSYTVIDAEISNFFEKLRENFEAAYYGMFFLEICDYYGRENNDEKEMLKLLYQTMRALSAEKIPNKLIQCIFIMKVIIINGEFPGISDGEFLDSTLYTVKYIEQSSIEKLYTFTVSKEVLEQLLKLSEKYRRCCMDKDFKSIEILENLS